MNCTAEDLLDHLDLIEEVCRTAARLHDREYALRIIREMRELITGEDDGSQPAGA